MLCGPEYVVLVDIESVPNEENGDRDSFVSNGKTLILKVDLVGLQTMQLGQSTGQNFSYSVEIPKIQYNKEKYCFFNNQLFEIKSLAKAKLPVNMLLLVSEIEDKQIYSAINRWLEERNDLQQRSN